MQKKAPSMQGSALVSQNSFSIVIIADKAIINSTDSLYFCVNWKESSEGSMSVITLL